ncbi:MAG: DUF4386 domain-containing protein [Candidatus Promineifilaceae bacterium]
MESKKMFTHRNAARLWGIFFIIAFLAYGIGSGMIDTITSTPDFLTNVNANTNTIIVGVILITLVHTFVNIGLPVLLMPILKPFHKNLTYGYLSFAIASTTIIVVSGIFLMLLIPLSGEYANAGSASTDHYVTIGEILKMGGFYAYQIGMAIWGMGGLLFVAVLYKSKIVSRVFSVWGFIGYAVFFAGTIFELFGSSVGVMLAIPGGLFEVSLSLWLIFKGFNSVAMTSDDQN